MIVSFVVVSCILLNIINSQTCNDNINANLSNPNQLNEYLNNKIPTNCIPITNNNCNCLTQQITSNIIILMNTAYVDQSWNTGFMSIIKTYINQTKTKNIDTTYIIYGDSSNNIITTKNPLNNNILTSNIIPTQFINNTNGNYCMAINNSILYTNISTILILINFNQPNIDNICNIININNYYTKILSINLGLFNMNNIEYIFGEYNNCVYLNNNKPSINEYHTYFKQKNSIKNIVDIMVSYICEYGVGNGISTLSPTMEPTNAPTVEDASRENKFVIAGIFVSVIVVIIIVIGCEKQLAKKIKQQEIFGKIKGLTGENEKNNGQSIKTPLINKERNE